MSDFQIAFKESFGDAPFFIFCDHASNAVPDDLNCLGLPGDILETHIAFDIGAKRLAEKLARDLQGTFFHCGFSRLVIDPNRDPSSPDLIPQVSDQIPVPGNQMLSEEDREARIARFHAPYHAMLDEALDDMTARENAPFIVSIHSFTNRLMGAAEDRPWPIGVLWRQDERSAQTLIKTLGETTRWPIGDNEPYDARVFNYTVDRHVDPRGLRHVTIETRQDLIGDQAGADDIAALLSAALKRCGG